MDWEERHRKYIQSDEWKKLRTDRVKLDQEKCQFCGDSQDLEVHHKYGGAPFYPYPKPLGQETLEDLITTLYLLK